MRAAPAFSVDPDALQSVWRADALASVGASVASTGHALLDAELPGAGWPLGAMVEVLQSTLAGGAWPLMLPALACQARVGRVALIQPPHEPYLPALVAAGLPWAQTLWVQGVTPAQASWAGEQALRCQDVAAVVAWLPRAQAGDLRRLHQAAASTGALLFVLRPLQAAQAASPARVRLQVTVDVRLPTRRHLRLVGAGYTPEQDSASGLQLRVDLLKRRGPPLQTPLWLPACGPSLQALLQTTQRMAPGAAQPLPDGLWHAAWPSASFSAPGAPNPQQRQATDSAGATGIAPAPTVHPWVPRRRHAQSVLLVQEDGHALAGVAVAAA